MSAQHMPSDLAGIKAATSAAPAGPDPMAAFLDALDELIEFAQDDAVSACEALPNGRGMRGPNTWKLDNFYAAAVAEARKLIAPQQAPEAKPALRSMPGVLTVHNPSARVAKATGAAS